MLVEQMLVGGRYRLGGRIGRGGMAEVRLGLDTWLGRAVAVKQLSDQLACDPVARVLFQREARSGASLKHPAVVAVLDTGEDSDPATGLSNLYIVMELVEGQTLRSMLHAGHTFPPEHALELTRGVLGALGQIHEAGIVHQDIKPANVMLTLSGNVKVMDFGIARAIADTSSATVPTTDIVGTVKYMAPERACGETSDVRSDLYSAGCVLYELLVGRPPFTGDSPSSIAHQHMCSPPVAPSERNAAIGQHFDAIALRALAKRPEERYQTAGEMNAHIEQVLTGRSALGQRVAAIEEQHQRPCRAALSSA